MLSRFHIATVFTACRLITDSEGFVKNQFWVVDRADRPLSKKAADLTAERLGDFIVYCTPSSKVCFFFLSILISSAPFYSILFELMWKSHMIRQSCTCVILHLCQANAKQIVLSQNFLHEVSVCANSWRLASAQSPCMLFLQRRKIFILLYHLAFSIAIKAHSC